MSANFTQDGFLKFVTTIAPIAAGDATIELPIFTFYNSEVTSNRSRLMRVSVIPQAAVTGNATNTKNLNVVYKGTDGLGTTEIGNLDLVAGEDMVAFQTKLVYESMANDGQGDLVEANGVVSLQVEQVGAGVDLPTLF